NHYPAIDVLQSVSRLQSEIQPPASQQAAGELRNLMAAYRDKEDLIAIGAYQPGGDPTVDTAIAMRPEINDFLRQTVDDRSDLAEADRRLAELSGALVQIPGETLPPEPPVDGPKTGLSDGFSAHQHGVGGGAFQTAG